MRICFYYEYKNIVGGLTSLLITLIKGLHKRNVEVVLFNHKNGLIQRELEACGIEINIIDLEEIDWKGIDKLIYGTDVFVLTGFAEVFHRFFKVNPKLIYYNIDDFLGNIGKYKFGINPKYLAKKLLGELIKNDSLVLMDDTGIRRAAEKLQFKIEHPLFLPVPVSVPAENQYLKKEKAANDTLRLTYIGRSVDWKLYPLKKVLDDLETANAGTKPKIVFTIVVDSIANLKKIVDIEKYQSKNVCEIIVHENIRPSEINTLLLNHSDLNFAMGTSALESGKLGIPTILMDFSTKDLPPNFKYLWLYHTKFFGLGRDIEKSYTPPVEGLDMSTLISKLYAEKEYIQIQSGKTYDYVKSFHSVEAIIDSLLHYAKGTTFRFRSAKSYILYYSALHRNAKKLALKLFR